MRSDPAFKPWRENALKRGYASSVVIPLKYHDKVFGAISMYATEPNRCSKQEVKLLTELGADFAYGITMLRLRKEKELGDQESRIMIEFLLIVNQSESTAQLIRRATDFFKKQSGCEAVGIRLKQENDYPYYETRGFSTEHLQLENMLCSYDEKGNINRDAEGNPVLDCMCGKIIIGKFSSEKEFFTKKGSFWTNSTTALLKNTTDVDRQARTRNRCNGEGYESVALIPLMVGKDHLGLIQLNDQRKNMFTFETIHMWERIADHLALALSKMLAEEQVKTHAEELERLHSILEEKAAEVEEYATNMENLAQERARKLQDSERLAAIGATAGMVGHDIRNPLQSITGDIYLAKIELDALPESEQKLNALESLVEIEKNLDYINKIVQDLQDYARPLNPKAEETDLKLTIEKLISKSSLPENINIEIFVTDDARMICFDTYYINRILYNLVTNSIQAMPRGGTVTVQGYKKTNDLVLTVKDTGVGIPESIKQKMFTPMFTTKSKGQGFGLPVVKRMTESLGGTVTFESTEGKGTTFIVRLPPPKS